MSGADILDQLRALPSAERRKVVSKIWEEFADAELELTAEQSAELDRRAADYAAHPRDVVPWDAIKAATKPGSPPPRSRSCQRSRNPHSRGCP